MSLPDTSKCRSCGQCANCSRQSDCKLLKLKSSISKVPKEPWLQSTRLETQLPAKSSVCRSGKVARVCREVSLLPLKSRYLCYRNKVSLIFARFRHLYKRHKCVTPTTSCTCSTSSCTEDKHFSGTIAFGCKQARQAMFQ